MGCSSCSTGGVPNGCKSNGSCGTGGCNKLTVFDWLADLEQPSGQKPFEWVEVRFKNGRKDFYKNVNELPLQVGDIIAVESSPGHDIGTVSITGDLVRLQMKKKGIKGLPEAEKKVYRKASQRDIDKWKEVREREQKTMMRSREIALSLGLQMKISDVEFQGDGAKAIFYYTADERVDFRQLIKDLAASFSTRIEMKQIGARQEAARLGGLGSCGRELCCSTWLTDFRSVNTAAARYQQLSLNPQKLAGQCGKLKCCLNYELDSYIEALKSFPDTGTPLKTEKGIAFYQKMDIFKRIMWYAYKDEPMTWVQLDVDTVLEIVEMNEKDEKPQSLESLANDESIEIPTFDNAVGQDSLTRFDRPKNKGKRRNQRNKKGRNNRQGAEASGGNAKEKPNNRSQSNRNRKPKQKQGVTNKGGDNNSRGNSGGNSGGNTSGSNSSKGGNSNSGGSPQNKRRNNRNRNRNRKNNNSKPNDS